MQPTDRNSQTLPPQAPERPRAVGSPHGERTDPYYWLRDDERRDPELLALLQAENSYREQVMAPYKALEDRLFGEIVGRVKQEDSTVPVRHRGYWYQTRYQTGQEYPVHVRWSDLPPMTEELLLDCNQLASGLDYFSLGSLDVSPDNRWMAYATDTVGRRQYAIRVKDLVTEAVLDDVVSNAEPGVAWAADGRSFIYVEKDPETLLGYRVRRHFLGDATGPDPLIYEEADDSFYLSVSASKSDEYLFIELHSTVSSEIRYARADDPALEFRVFEPRERDHEYLVEHVSGHFFVRTNWQARNFRLMRIDPESEGGRESWREVVPHDPSIFIEDFDLLAEFLAVSERSGAVRRIRLRDLATGRDWYVQEDEPTFTMSLAENPEPDSHVLRYTCESLVTPLTTFDLDLRTGERRLVKREPVLGDFDPELYATELLHAPSRDGKRVPVSIAYRKDTLLDGTAPLYLYAYGAYGYSMDQEFHSSMLSLLDRGFVFAIAHVRGGQELGREWYESGRQLHKKRTFEDFVDVTRFLAEQKIAAPDKVCAIGGSAGGLLVAAVLNDAPQLYRAVVAHVPFVDVVTTMLDPSLPLTTNEYDEWGDPSRREFYDYMLSYSPYDNVRPRPYPAVLATTGLWDSQVQYWEPVKWVQKLRRASTSGQPILLRADLDAGHGGKSGRFRRFREVAEEFAFLLAMVRPAGAGLDAAAAPAPGTPASRPPERQPA
jgi:oligopeptidase B